MRCVCVGGGHKLFCNGPRNPSMGREVCLLTHDCIKYISYKRSLHRSLQLAKPDYYLQHGEVHRIERRLSGLFALTPA